MRFNIHIGFFIISLSFLFSINSYAANSKFDSEGSLIRYDGIYFMNSAGNKHRGLRFFSNGMAVASSYRGNPQDSLTAFSLSNPHLPKGEYDISGNTIKITMKTRVGTIEYSGMVNDDNLKLNWHNTHKNKKGTKDYKFVQIQNEAPIKQNEELKKNQTRQSTNTQLQVNGKLKLDGGYFIKEKRNWYRGLRFFDDGKVTGATIVHHPKNSLDSFKKNDRLQNNGTYVLDGNNITINMVFSSKLKREYQGIIKDNKITLSWKDYQNNTTNNETFEFIKMQSKGEAIRSLWSDKKNCKEEGAYIISIAAFKSSYKIASCAMYGCRIAVPGFGKKEQPYSYKSDPRFNWISETEFDLKIKDKSVHFYSCTL
jgi:hypothetical protein